MRHVSFEQVAASATGEPGEGRQMRCIQETRWQMSSAECYTCCIESGPLLFIAKCRRGGWN